MSYFELTIDEMTFVAAKKNKTAAQRKIYDLYSQSIYNLCTRVLNNEADALDITQEVFIKIFLKIDQCKSTEVFGAWVRKITINMSLSYIKKNARLITNVNFKEKTITNNSIEITSSLEYALSKLPTIPRTILWLYEVEGLSHQEIADNYGKTISFSKTNLSRAKALALSYLTTKGGGYEAIK
ncbi:MAG: sigma-70 family RNA polymerase sigma factor [Proteobacteria bacterium]|nr:sigma-70 family RNA polymerase sigma factor [Pseudomonadota bacterium]